MSLSASMWTGVSGLLGHGEKMNVVGNNLANVSTVGFKAQRMDFEDYMYATTHSASGQAQIGRGVDIGIIMGDFSQGAFESTNSAIDLAISGAGFFKVQRIGTEQGYYTRAGNFQFNTEGYLVDPHGYAVQGWKIDNTAGPTRSAGGAGPSSTASSGIRGTGVPVDVRLDTWTVPPKATSKVSIIANLSANGADNSKNTGNPFVSLIQSWDGTQPPQDNRPAIAETSYAFSAPIKVYDESGLTHTLTVYYDKVQDTSYDGNPGETLWEYIVTMDPSEDKRQFWDASANGGNGGLRNLSETKAAGLLMSGVMAFNSAGSLLDQTAYTLFGGLEYTRDDAGNPVEDDNYRWADPARRDRGLVPQTKTLPAVVPGQPTPTGLDTWQDITRNMYTAAVSNSGYPLMVANFTGAISANTAGSPNGENYLIEFNLGMKVEDQNNPWTIEPNVDLYTATQVPNQATGRLVENPYRTSNNDSQHGPKIVEQRAAGNAANPTGYNQMLSDSYITALQADGGTPGAQVTAWLTQYEAQNAVYAGQQLTREELIQATWPYETNWPFNGPPRNNGFNPSDLQKLQALVDKTPQTTALGWMTNRGEREAYATTMLGTNYALSNGTGQNGYTFGNLTGYDVDAEGVLSGIYSNGVTLGLYQLTLYDFTCHQGLRREGGNLYSQTLDSGEAFFGAPQTNGMGKINSYALEQSNVDMSREFVQMITTQRGFQANSKVITTTDTMLEVVVNMKR